MTTFKETFHFVYDNIKDNLPVYADEAYISAIMKDMILTKMAEHTSAEKAQSLQTQRQHTQPTEKDFQHAFPNYEDILASVAGEVILSYIITPPQ